MSSMTAHMMRVLRMALRRLSSVSCRAERKHGGWLTCWVPQTECQAWASSAGLQEALQAGHWRLLESQCSENRAARQPAPSHRVCSQRADTFSCLVVIMRAV